MKLIIVQANDRLLEPGWPFCPMYIVSPTFGMVGGGLIHGVLAGAAGTPLRVKLELDHRPGMPSVSPKHNTTRLKHNVCHPH